VVCFDLTNRVSLENACTKWLAELRDTGPALVAKTLVGCKLDLREEGNPDHVQEEEAIEMANKYKFLSYEECSALLFKNCDTVFSEAVRTSIIMQKMATGRGNSSRNIDENQKCFFKGQTVTRLNKNNEQAEKCLIEDIKIKD
jgi:GTPase SAR1 family protein